MKIIDGEQGSPEWHQLRLGRITASQADKLVTPTGKPSSQASALVGKMVYERFCNLPAGDNSFTSSYIEDGIATEPEALASYGLVVSPEELADQIRTVCFVLMDNDAGNYIGCSPDALVGDEGLVEIKCPADWTHLQYLAEGIVPKTYYPQIQFQLWVTGRDWCDFYSYSKRFQPLVKRVKPDEAFFQAFEKSTRTLLDKVVRLIDTLHDMGIDPGDQAFDGLMETMRS